jgi:hypothetical protein
MNTTYSTLFRKAREDALVAGNATAYNAFDRLYKEAVNQEALEAKGALSVFSNVAGA